MNIRLYQLLSERPLIALFLALLLSFILFSPGLNGGFIFDDEVNIVRNKQVHLDSLDVKSLKDAALGGNSGPLKRPVSMFSFAVNYYLHELNPFAYKVTNLIIHLLNGIGIFITSLLALRTCKRFGYISTNDKKINTVALLTTTVWMIHPINLTTALYVVQRMNSLSSLFMIYGFIAYIAIRIKLLSEKRLFPLLVISTTLCTLLATLSKENGILLPIYIAAFEILIFRFRASDRNGRKLIAAFFFITAVMPVIGVIVYFSLNPEWILGTYLVRDFTLIERLLTEARAIWFYLYLILLPNLSSLGIFHDDFLVSRGLFDPASTILSLAGLCLIVFTIFRCYKAMPLVSFGLAFFLIGHSIESTFIGLELVHEHRNYLPSFGILLVLCYFILGHHWKHSKRIAQPLIVISILGFLSLTTLFRSLDWGNPGRLYLMEATHHPESSRAHFQLGQTYLRLMEIDPNNKSRYENNARKHLMRSTELNTSFTDGLFALIQMDNLANSEIDSKQVDELIKRLKAYPYSPNNINWIDRFTSCTPLPDCAPPAGIMHRIFSASLSNESTRRVKAELYTMASKYAVEVEKDPNRALELIISAANVAPANPRYKIHVATLLVLMDQKQEALRYLDEAKRLDWLGINSSKIKEVIKFAEELKPAQPLQG